MMLNISRTFICLWIIIPMVFSWCPPRESYHKTLREEQFWVLARMCGYRLMKELKIQHDGEWHCYKYTATELLKITTQGFTEKQVCENSKHNRKYTKGHNKYAAGCNENCWCCEKTKEWKCYTYTKAERDLFTNNSDISEHKVCERNGKLYTAEFWKDKLAPGCGKCRCCQRA